LPVADPRQFSAPAERNSRPILDVLRQVLPASGVVLEVASGSGQHAAFLAPQFPSLIWQPSDPSAVARASIQEWTAGIANMRPPVDLDATAAPWPALSADAVVCINMIHIAPWAACLGLLQGAAGLLAPGAPLYLYGPYRRDGRDTAPSNAAFDADLKARNPAWGVRDLETVAAAAAAAGFGPPAIIPMPANNLSVVFRRLDRAPGHA
jgi:SAM-dependent methyltransferase